MVTRTVRSNGKILSYEESEKNIKSLEVFYFLLKKARSEIERHAWFGSINSSVHALNVVIFVVGSFR